MKKKTNESSLFRKSKFDKNTNSRELSTIAIIKYIINLVTFNNILRYLYGGIFTVVLFTIVNPGATKRVVLLGGVFILPLVFSIGVMAYTIHRYVIGELFLYNVLFHIHLILDTLKYLKLIIGKLNKKQILIIIRNIILYLIFCGITSQIIYMFILFNLSILTIFLINIHSYLKNGSYSNRIKESQIHINSTLGYLLCSGVKITDARFAYVDIFKNFFGESNKKLKNELDLQHTGIHVIFLTAIILLIYSSFMFIMDDWTIYMNNVSYRNSFLLIGIVFFVFGCIADIIQHSSETKVFKKHHNDIKCFLIENGYINKKVIGKIDYNLNNAEGVADASILEVAKRRGLNN